MDSMEPSDLSNTSGPLTPIDPPVAEPSLPPSPPPPSLAHSLFFGRFGFRAGWGMAIFILIVFLLTLVSGIAAVAASGQLKQVIAARMAAQAHPGAPKPAVVLPFTATLVTTNDALSFLGMLAACWFFAKAERRRLGFYGIGSSRLYDFVPGAFWGLASLSALVCLLTTFHFLYFDSRLLTGPAIYLYALKWLIAFLFVGFSEEYMLRGYLQFTLTRGVYGLGEKLSPTRPHFAAFWIAATVMSLLFACLHLGNHGENALGIFQVFLVGMVFSYALWRTGSLWWSIGWHMAWDWAQSFLYGVADSGNISVGRLFQTHVAGKPLLSGGVDGPEGSILCVPILLLTFLVIRYTTRPGVQPPLAPLPPSTTPTPEIAPVIA